MIGKPLPRPGSGPRAVGPALEAAYQFILWLIPTVEKFPRNQKFQLGDRIQNDALNVLERLIEVRRVGTFLCPRVNVAEHKNVFSSVLWFFRVGTKTKTCPPYVFVPMYAKRWHWRNSVKPQDLIVGENLVVSNSANPHEYAIG